MNIVILIILHIALAIVLFIGMNWIGQHSLSFGYKQLSLHYTPDEAPAFNLILRFLAPIVFIIIISALIINTPAVEINRNIYCVVIYYFIIRILFNVLMGKARLLNWWEQVSIGVGSSFLAYYIYEKLLKNNKNILPDFTTLSNELWIIIAIFIYHVFNKIRFNQAPSIRRKENYIANRFNFFSHKYGSIINNRVQSKKLSALIYAIMIFEAFNRPKIARMIETKLLIFKKPRTLGVMQVKTSIKIDDSKSVALGVDKILQDFKELADIEIDKSHQLKEKYYGSEYSLLINLIQKYNGGELYSSEVHKLYYSILERFFHDSVQEEIIPSDKLYKKVNNGT